MGLFSLRFFLQQGPKMHMQPYLHLPIRREKIVRFFQVFSLLSFHNAIPYLFFIPFTIQFIYFANYGISGTVVWFTGITLVLLLSHYANNLLRALHKKSSIYYLVTVSVLAIAFLLDEVIDMHVLRTFSEILFGELLEGNIALLALLAFGTIGMFIYSSMQIKEQLLAVPSSSGAMRGRQITFAPERGQVINLILLEMKMIWRNKRPKHYFILSIVFALAYIALMLAESHVFNTSAISAVIGIFASGTFALNYGQLMFSWESSYFDGFMTRNIRAGGDDCSQTNDFTRLVPGILYYKSAFVYTDEPGFALTSCHLSVLQCRCNERSHACARYPKPTTCEYFKKWEFFSTTKAFLQCIGCGSCQL